MIPNDTPWSGLEAGKVDTRRVSASARWSWFWAVMPRADAALVLQLSELPDPVPDLPRLKNLEIRFQTLPGGPILYIRLKDQSQIELFEALCRDVMNAGEIAGSEREALERAVGRTFRWHHLLRGGKSETLTEEEQKGLVGEIEVLKLLMQHMTPAAALTAWTGPSGAPKDFELARGCIEVKARRSGAQPYVRISNEHQLADVTGKALWMAVLAVDRVHFPHGKTLAEIVAVVSEAIKKSEPAALFDWELHLADCGYDSAHDYSGWRWIVAEPAFYEVTDHFPRVVSPLVEGVSAVTYSISLHSCTPYQVTWKGVRTALFDEDNDE